MNSRQRVLTALACGQPDKVPFMELGIDYGIGQRILKKDSYTQTELADFLQLDGVGTGAYPNIYVKRQIINTRSYIVDGMIKSRDDLAQIKLIDPNDPSLLDGVKRLIDGNKAERLVFAATNMGLDPVLLGMGMDGFSYACYDDMELIKELLDMYVDWTVRAVENIQKLGVDAIWFTDDIAFNTSMMFDPSFFREVAAPRLKRVSDVCKVPIIFHSDGYILPVMDDLIKLGVSGFHPMDPCALDIHEVKKQYNGRVCLLGNIDLRHTLIDAPVEEVREEVRDRIQTIGLGGGYIICSANSITNYCSPDNVIAMRDAIEEFGWY